MLDELKGSYERNKGNSLPLMINVDTSESKVCTLRKNNNVLEVSEGTSEDNIFALMGDDKDSPIKVKGAPSLTYKDLRDTAENPLIMVATDGIRFFNDVPTFVKVLFVNDDFFLVMLVYGACEMKLGTSYVPLQRCNSDDIERKGIHSAYSTSAFKEMVYNRTKGNWDKSYEMVCPVYVKVKGGDSTFRCLQNDPNSYGVFNASAIEERLKYEEDLAEQKKKQREDAEFERVERKKRYEESKRRREEEERLNRIEENKRKAEEAKAKRGSAKARKLNVPTTDEKGRNTAAEAFLAFVNGGK